VEAERILRLRYPDSSLMRRRVLVFGSAGQLGVELVREMNARGYEVFGWDRDVVDITDAARVEQQIASLDPEVVYNAAAYNMVDVAESEPAAAYHVNALAVRNLAVACRQCDARLVHYSTDYVFDGKAGRPYAEQDSPHPLNAYGVSKLAGELYAFAYLDNALVIRTCGVFGPGGLRTARGNFVELMLRLASSGQPIRVVEDHVASPTFSPLLASRSIDLVEANHTGVFHVGGGTPISWFDYAKLIFEAANLHAEVHPTSEREYRTAARRPKYSALSNSKMEGVGLSPMPPLADALQDYMEGRVAWLPDKTKA
jgi:dTDP-4-dehydrorhamnose reductase